jgi:ABC-type branched-subunit amino acid transport system substrate-binding protein
MGTKVAQLNPGAFGASGGGPQSDALALKAAYQAGYRGQLIGIQTTLALSLTQVLPPEVLEGFINGAYPVEFDPPLTQSAKDFKATWTAKYGKWEGPNTMMINYFCCLAAALEKAGTLDTDKLASLIGSGFKFESPNGDVQMISRPDLGNNRTVDSVATSYLKRIKGGQPTLLGTIPQEEALQYYRIAHPAK